MQEWLLMKVANEDESEPFKRPLELYSISGCLTIIGITNLLLVHHDKCASKRLGAGGCGL